MDFRILGPLEVADEAGTLVRLPAGRARIALALLCVNAGQVVSRDRLIDEAWNGAPPATAVTQVQGFISALRRQLGAGTILTRGDGYLLAPCSIDLTKMRTLVREARAMREAGSLAHAAALLRDALALWRGRPFEGIGCVSLEASADLIDQERAGALEEYAEIELALGGTTGSSVPALTSVSSASLAEQLAGWAAEYPLREGLRGLLIQALLLTGRQAEAIAAYHELRERLADQLGIDPGPALQDLYARILGGDRSLMTVSVPDAPPPVPAQMPAGVPDFTGRTEQVRQLRAALSRQKPAAVVVSALSGTGGVGKTTLAVHVAHLISDSFPGGQLFVNLAGTSAEPAAPGDVLARLLRDLGLPAAEVPAGLDECSARYRSMLAGRHVLLVLDDARDAVQVRPLLPGSPTCAVLVTSREALTDLAGAVHVGLSVLEPGEGEELFVKIVGSARAEAEPDAVADVVRMCAGVPLAIRIAAAKLVASPEWSIAEVASRIAAEHGSRTGQAKRLASRGPKQRA